MTGDIASAGAGLRSGTTTAVDLLETTLAAVAAHNAATNAFITVDADGARVAARAVDRERAQGLDRGPLHGIPISLKDLIDEAGVVTTAGSRVMSDRVARRDATIVTRLRDAGAVLFGRTNLHEFACGPTGEDSAFGPVRHPLDGNRIAGGSSSGSAVAVATGMGLASIGSDTGGSIRIPAALCGVVGLKPSIGEVPLEGVIPLCASLDHVGPLARTVQDAAWVFAALAGRALAPVEPVRPSTLVLRRISDALVRPVEPIVQRAWGAALERLRAAGVVVLDGEIDGAAASAEIYANIVLPEAAHWHARFLDARAALYTPPVRERIDAGRVVSAVAYVDALEARALLRRAVEGALEGCDALILPTLPVVAPRIGSATLTIEGETLPMRATLLKHTRVFNLSGHPAISLPIPSSGLPVGLQIVGQLGHTERLLDVAAGCEALLRS